MVGTVLKKKKKKKRKKENLEKPGKLIQRSR
jgi:hypothetical protein